jgi:hypothetical protein
MSSSASLTAAFTIRSAIYRRSFSEHGLKAFPFTRALAGIHGGFRPPTHRRFGSRAAATRRATPARQEWSHRAPSCDVRVGEPRWPNGPSAGGRCRVGAYPNSSAQAGMGDGPYAEVPVAKPAIPRCQPVKTAARTSRPGSRESSPTRPARSTPVPAARPTPGSPRSRGGGPETPEWHPIGVGL